MLHDIVGSGIYNMAASKPEIQIYQLVDMMETKSQPLDLCFRGPKLVVYPYLSL